MSEITFPDKLVNFANIRVRVKDLVGSDSDIPLNLRERVIVADIIGRAPRVPFNKKKVFARVAEHKLHKREEPRFKVLNDFLSLDNNYITAWPELILEVTQYLLGETTDQVHSRLDWDGLKSRYPDIF